MSNSVIFVYPNEKILTGAHRRYHYLIRRFIERGYKVTLVSPIKYYDDINWVKADIKSKSAVPISLQLVLQTIKSISNLRRFINKEKTTVIVFGETNLLTAFILKVLLKVKVIYCPRSNVLKIIEILDSDKGIVSKARFKLQKLYIKFFASIMDKIVLQNEEDKDYYKTILKIQNGKLNIIPNNINVDWILQEGLMKENYNHTPKKFLFIGSLSKIKGINILIEAMTRYNIEYPESKLMIYGNGPELTTIQSMINENDMNNKIQLLGNIENPLRVYREFDLLIVPSITDSSPNVLLEGLYCGLPAIGSNVGGIKEILSDKNALFDVNDVNSLYNKMKFVSDCKNYELVKNNGVRAREHLFFNWEERFEKLISDLHEVDQ